MVVKVYVSGISGNKEVKKRQQRVLMILDSKTIKYEVIDIAEPGNESDKDFMQNNSKHNGGTVSDPNPRHALPPQLFNDEEYCGDYDQFDLANEVDTLEQFLKVEAPLENNIVEKVTPQNNVDDAKEETNKDDDENEEEVESNKEPEKQKSEDAKADIETVPDSKDVHIGDGKHEEHAEPKESVATESAEVDEDKKVDVEKIVIDDKIEEISTAVEKSDERVKSEEREVITEKVENNGVTSSREPSVEKKAAEPENTASEPSKNTDKSPSKALIESEQVATE